MKDHFKLSCSLVIALLAGCGLIPVTSKANDTPNLGLFYSYESNGIDYFSGIGMGITFADADSHMGMNFNTSLKTAEVLATDGYLETFSAWEGGIKFGYFSDVSLYVEAGIDLSELIYQDWRYEDDYYDYHHYDNNQIDAYIGGGFGISSGPVSFEAFSRHRNIDSDYWQARSDWYSGFAVSLNF